MQAFRQLGPYELIERLAVGGMAEIYVARAKGVQGFEKEYVLKLIHPKYVGDHEFIRMLVDEAKLVGALTHPNVAQVIDLGLDGESYYILMEYVRGKDLYQVLNTAWDLGFNLPLPMCLHVARDMCAGLYYAHHKSDETGRPLNIVHRDISPQNVLISYNGEAKIVDFGVAKAALGARPETRAGIIKGKFRYMSPEQAWGEKLDGRSDLFSVGLCLYEMVCGETAYDDDGDMQKMLVKMRDAQFVPPSRHRPEVDAELESIMMKALSRDRNDRYPTCHAFEVALASYMHRRFPGYTPMDVTTVMKEMYPEQTGHIHVPEPTERTTANDDIPMGTAELEAMGFVELDDSRDTGDMTLRQSIVRGPAAGPPDAGFSQDSTDFFHQEEEPTRLDLDREDLLTDEATVDLPGLRAKQALAGPGPMPVAPGPLSPNHQPQRAQRAVHATPSRGMTGPGFQAQNPNYPTHQPERPGISDRQDTVAEMIERFLPESAAEPALRFHQKMTALLESDGGSNILVLVLGLTLGLFILLLIVLIAL